MSSQDQILGHADECDGIEEYDNKMPAWWLGLLYGTIVWAVTYGVHYHFYADRSQVGAWQAEMAAAELRWPAPDPDAVVEVTEASIEAGSAVFQTNCVGCHGADLTGGIGPNLTDAEWIHGGTLAEIRHTISEGVPEKGMLSWGPILGPERVAQVAAFVHSKGGGL